LYEQFLSLGVTPEQLRNMPAFDVYMIQYAWMAKSANKWHQKNRQMAGSGVGTGGRGGASGFDSTLGGLLKGG